MKRFGSWFLLLLLFSFNFASVSLAHPTLDDYLLNDQSIISLISNRYTITIRPNSHTKSLQVEVEDQKTSDMPIILTTEVKKTRKGFLYPQLLPSFTSKKEKALPYYALRFLFPHKRHSGNIIKLKIKPVFTNLTICTPPFLLTIRNLPLMKSDKVKTNISLKELWKFNDIDESTLLPSQIVINRFLASNNALFKGHLFSTKGILEEKFIDFVSPSLDDEGEDFVRSVVNRFYPKE